MEVGYLSELLKQLKGKKIIITDIDNTIADNTHRLYSSYNGVLNQKLFLNHENMLRDTPYPIAKDVLLSLVVNGFKIIYLTGRPESTKKVTQLWLTKNNFTSSENIICKSEEEYKRKSPDHMFKHRWVREIKKVGKIIMAFDDRERTVDMYDSNLIPVVRIRHLDDWLDIQRWIHVLWM
jgi:predicted secreted acid phosphatase